MKKVAVFIDNSNIFHNIRQIREADRNWICLYDPLELAKKLVGDRELVYVGFYCTQPPVYLLQEDEKHVKKYKTTRAYYSAVEKLENVEVKYGDLRGTKDKPDEKNLDTQLTADMIKMAALNKYDIAILITNDGDYVSAVEGAKELGKKVELVFFKGKISMALKGKSDITRRARRSYFQKLEFAKQEE